MPRMKPEKYLAWAKKRAIKRIRSGRVLDGTNTFCSDLVKHPVLYHHPQIDNTYAMIDPLYDCEQIDVDKLIEHLKNDY